MGYCYNSFIDMFLFITSCLVYVNKKNTRNELIIVRALRYLRPSQLKAAENSAKCCGANIPKGRGTFDGETYRPVVKYKKYMGHAKVDVLRRCVPVQDYFVHLCVIVRLHGWSRCSAYNRWVA